MSDHPKPSDTLIVALDGKERELFMSFALQNLLSRLIGDPERAAGLALDPALSRTVLKEVLSERTRSGKLSKEIQIDDVDISTEDALAVLEWVTDHTVDFFIRSALVAKRIGEKHAGRVTALMPSSAGTAT